MNVTGALGLPSDIRPSGVRSLTVVQSMSGVGVRVGSGVGVSVEVLVGSGDGVLVGGGSVACTMAGASVAVAAESSGGGSGDVSGSGWVAAGCAVVVAVTKATSAFDPVDGAEATPQAGNSSTAHKTRRFAVRILNNSPLMISIDQFDLYTLHVM